MTRLQKLALAAAAVTYLVVVMGAVTRSTGSGMGCGTDWPLCHGVLPALSDDPAWIEWWHRVFALLLGVLVAAVAGVGAAALPRPAAGGRAVGGGVRARPLPGLARPDHDVETGNRPGVGDGPPGHGDAAACGS